VFTAREEGIFKIFAFEWLIDYDYFIYVIKYSPPPLPPPPRSRVCAATSPANVLGRFV
jgi:hypothetical protein